MNKNQVNDVVFEALFLQAVIDDFNEEIDYTPTNEQLAKIYSFSPEFELRMKKLFTKDRRKDFIKTITLYCKRVASVLIIVLGLLFSTLLFNTEVRAAVGNVLVEWYEKFTSFTFRDDEIIDEKKESDLLIQDSGGIISFYFKHEPYGKLCNNPRDAYQTVA